MRVLLLYRRRWGLFYLPVLAVAVAIVLVGRKLVVSASTACAHPCS
jgi:hypothetical protein